MALQKLIGFINILLAAGLIGCSPQPDASPETDRSATKVSGAIAADEFAWPVGNGSALTQAKDRKDDWFNALDFGENDHLGEGWNKNTGGNTDCGQSVFAAGNGVIAFAGDAGPGWGNVLIVTHRLPDGKKIQTLYGHLQSITKAAGEVKIRDEVGKIGNANGRYLCHLHFELRDESCPVWDRSGPGYSSDQTGRLDPSDFIQSRQDAD